MLYVCLDCGQTMTRPIDALGHDPESNWTIDKAATCVEAGEKSHHCSRCDEHLDVTEIPATGEHRYDDGVTVLEPTCTEYGKGVSTCLDCGYKHEYVIFPLGHDLTDDWIIDVEPTCESDGEKSHHCQECGERFDVTVVSALGHDYGEGVVTTEPTCTEVGIKTFTCSHCNDSYEVEIPALGHSYDKGVITKSPTCIEEGLRVYTCSRCGGTKEEVLAKVKHQTTTTLLEATHASNGHLEEVCDVCGELVRQFELAPLSVTYSMSFSQSVSSATGASYTRGITAGGKGGRTSTSGPTISNPYQYRLSTFFRNETTRMEDLSTDWGSSNYLGLTSRNSGAFDYYHIEVEVKDTIGNYCRSRVNLGTGELESSHIEDKKYVAYLDGELVETTFYNASLRDKGGDSWDEQYVAQLDVTAGQTLILALNSSGNVKAEIAEGDNNLGEGLVVKETATAAHLYVRYWKDGTRKLYLTDGSESSQGQGESTDYACLSIYRNGAYVEPRLEKLADANAYQGKGIELFAGEGFTIKAPGFDDLGYLDIVSHPSGAFEQGLGSTFALVKKTGYYDFYVDMSLGHRKCVTITEGSAPGEDPSSSSQSSSSSSSSQPSSSSSSSSSTQPSSSSSSSQPSSSSSSSSQPSSSSSSSQPSSSSSSSQAPTTAKVTFSVTKSVSYGQAVYLVGTDPIGWSFQAKYRLEWSTGDVWKGQFDLPLGSLEYKYVVANYDGTGDCTWEGGNNRVVNITKSVAFNDTWQD